MHLLSTRIHGVFDYLLGVIMLASPWLFGFTSSTMASMVAILIGASVLGYSFFTDYPLGGARLLSFNAHLSFDLMSGLFLFVCSFWVSYRWEVAWPLFIFAVLLIVGVVFTGFQGDDETNRHIGRPIGT